ncbi:nitrate ABC transporter substrate-binding protein, partial [Klebsiella michiganensis]
MKTRIVALTFLGLLAGRALAAEPAFSDADPLPARIVLLVDEITATRHLPMVLA